MSKNYYVVGLDNLNNYYSKKLKKDRIEDLKNNNFRFIKIDLKNKSKLFGIFKKFKPKFVYHLAAQAGVRYSLLKPQNYIDNNITVFQNILELSKTFKIKLLIYGSSSSVYGDNKDDVLGVKQNRFPYITLWG